MPALACALLRPQLRRPRGLSHPLPNQSSSCLYCSAAGRRTRCNSWGDASCDLAGVHCCPCAPEGPTVGQAWAAPRRCGGCCATRACAQPPAWPSHPLPTSRRASSLSGWSDVQGVTKRGRAGRAGGLACAEARRAAALCQRFSIARCDCREAVELSGSCARPQAWPALRCWPCWCCL